MPISNIFQHKLYSDTLASQPKKLPKIPRWAFWLYTICIILNLTNKSFAEEQAPDGGKNSIADIINKAVGIKTPEAKNNQGSRSSVTENKVDEIANVIKKAKVEKTPEVKNNQGGNSISKIVSSLVKKNNEPSLMFSDEEITKIDQALDAYINETPFDALETKEDKKEQEPESPSADKTNSYIYLESILYHSPSNWSAWINGQKISSTDNRSSNELYVKSISADTANILWTMSVSKWKILTNQTSENGAPININNQVELNFNLSFNQTYMLVGGKIIEGRIKLGSNDASRAWGGDKKLTDSLGELGTDAPINSLTN